MSGGVDSAVAALLLAREGHEVHGAYMKNWMNEDNIVGECPWEEDIEDARAAAQTLGIPFRVINLMEEYRERIVQYLLDGYSGGITPNPDVLCNREIKFGAFREVALSEGFEAVATGHYARIERSGGSVVLLEGSDKSKDQSYFLALLRQDQLERARFPIGALMKKDVRAMAREAGLAVAGKRDSQGICFIGRVRMNDFLRAYVPDRPGPIVTLDNRQVGEHAGLHLYTIGQRRGLRVASNTPHKAYVVVGKRPSDNALLIGFDEPDTAGLYRRRARAVSLSFTGKPWVGRHELEARPRYRAPRCPVAVEFGEHDAAMEFAVPQRAIAAGQICAFYDGERLLGGGVFVGES